MLDLEDFATRYTAAWCSQNAASVAAFFAPDGSLTINHGTPSVGREKITAAAQSFMTAFPDLQVILDSIIDGAIKPNITGRSSAPTLAPAAPAIPSVLVEWSAGSSAPTVSSHPQMAASTAPITIVRSPPKPSHLASTQTIIRTQYALLSGSILKLAYRWSFT